MPEASQKQPQQPCPPPRSTQPHSWCSLKRSSSSLPLPTTPVPAFSQPFTPPRFPAGTCLQFQLRGPQQEFARRHYLPICPWGPWLPSWPIKHLQSRPVESANIFMTVCPGDRSCEIWNSFLWCSRNRGWEVVSFDVRHCSLHIFLSQEKHALSPCISPFMSREWYTGYTKNWKFRKPLLPSVLCLWK